ncbi:hypothetical protein AX15_007812 [Amanita polypyramis BW_CC]|nr:hypothetical protein AX15_007812 [Amanita polypyramis BW_CC]
MAKIIPEPSLPPLSLLFSSPFALIQQICIFIFYWINNIRTRHVGHPCVIRSTGKIVREQQPLTTKLRNLLLFFSPLEFIDTSQAFRLYLHHNADVAGKYERSPESKKDVRPFAERFHIDMDEFDPSYPDAYPTFNDFFIRRFREGARPLAAPDDQRVMVAAAESRMVAYDSVELTQKFWIKGRGFSIESLLGTTPHADEGSCAPTQKPTAGGMARTWQSGSIAIHRLSPQDYHHFHSPISGTVTYVHHIPGNYYGVDPLCINSSVSVLDSNARTVMVIRSEEFGQVLFVAIGASEVGSVDVSLKPGDCLTKGDEVGKFMYGGSSILIAFERGRVEWDEDIREASLRGLMVDVRVKERVGICIEVI